MLHTDIFCSFYSAVPDPVMSKHFFNLSADPLTRPQIIVLRQKHVKFDLGMNKGPLKENTDDGCDKT